MENSELRKPGQKRRADEKIWRLQFRSLWCPLPPKYWSDSNSVPMWYGHIRHKRSLPTYSLSHLELPNTDYRMRPTSIFKRTPNSAWWKSDGAAYARRDESFVNHLFQWKRCSRPSIDILQPTRIWLQILPEYLLYKYFKLTGKEICMTFKISLFYP